MCQANYAPSNYAMTSCANMWYRCIKDIAYTDKEIASQKERIQKVKDDPEKDEHDVKKQEEVLEEYVQAKPREIDSLEEYLGQLKTLIEEHKDNESITALDEWTKASDACEAGTKRLAELRPQDDD